MKPINTHRSTIKSRVGALLPSLIALCCCLTSSLVAAPSTAREANCFRIFDPNAIGRNDVNAYLLIQLSSLVYADVLAREARLAGDITVTEALLQSQQSTFKTEFVKRTRHWFCNAPEGISPTSLQGTGLAYDWLFTRDASGGADAEIMVISSSNAVFVVCRGTDRVGGTDSSFSYDFGEWIKTDAIAFLQAPYSGASTTAVGRVHQGMNSSLHYARDGTGLSYILHLTQLITNRVGDTGKPIWITGHSLGASVSQLVAFYLQQYRRVKAHQLVLFASAHPGDEIFAKTLTDMYPDGRIQRYEFIDDPVTMLGGRYMGFGRAGVRNHILQATGTGKIQFNAGERSGDDFGAIAGLAGSKLSGFGGACFHYQSWYANGCFSVLSSALRAQVPAPPPFPLGTDEGCNSFDVNKGKSGNIADPGTDDLMPGTYTIRNVGSGNLLVAQTKDCDFVPVNNCCHVVQQGTAPTGDAHKWVIARVAGATFDSYTIKSVSSGTVIDAQIACAQGPGNDCEVKHCNRLAKELLRTNQEWAFEGTTPGRYKIRCIAGLGGKYLRCIANCSGDKCRVILSKSSGVSGGELEFILTKQ